MDIIQYLLSFIQYQHQQICWLLNFICRYIPLKQWAFDDSHSPKYQKFKVDELPVIKTFVKQHTRACLKIKNCTKHVFLSPFHDRIKKKGAFICQDVMN